MKNKILDDLMKQIKQWVLERKLVIWIGVGVSIDTPTLFPSGKELTYFMLKIFMWLLEKKYWWQYEL